MALGTPADLAAARTKLVANAATGRKDAATMISFLRLVRELGVQDPEAVCEHGSYVLAHCKGKLSVTECAESQPLECTNSSAGQCSSTCFHTPDA